MKWSLLILGMLSLASAFAQKPLAHPERGTAEIDETYLKHHAIKPEAQKQEEEAKLPSTTPREIKKYKYDPWMDNKIKDSDGKINNRDSRD